MPSLHYVKRSGPILLIHKALWIATGCASSCLGIPAEKARLENILHPLIFAQAKREAATATETPYTLIVVPLLFESGRYADWLQRVVTVDCPEDAQITRTIQRSNLNASTVRSIMAQQLGRDERKRLADEVISNNGSLDDLKAQVDAMHLRLCTLAAESD